MLVAGKERMLTAAAADEFAQEIREHVDPAANVSSLPGETAVQRSTRQLTNGFHIDHEAIDRMSDAELVAKLQSLGVPVNPGSALLEGGKPVENDAQAIQTLIADKPKESSGSSFASNFGSGSGSSASSSSSSGVSISIGPNSPSTPQLPGATAGTQQQSAATNGADSTASTQSAAPTLYEAFQKQQQQSPDTASMSSVSAWNNISPTPAVGEASSQISSGSSASSFPNSSPVESSSSEANSVQGPEPGMSAERLFGGVDISALMQPYGAPDRDMRIDEQVQMLPPTEETLPPTSEEQVHRYPDENKSNTVESNKEIHTYTVQKHRVNMKKLVTERDLKVVNVNTNFVTNVRHINHPHKLTEIVRSEQIRHVPEIIVKHTRTDKVNDIGAAQEIPTQEVREQSVELPPIIEQTEVQRVGYDGKLQVQP